MDTDIAIIAMACRYPDADNPDQLWHNVIGQRRAFRKIPDTRLRLDDYLDHGQDNPDATYGAHAALIAGYGFDRLRFRLPPATEDVVDPVHLLALDVADEAVRACGVFERAPDLRDDAMVIVGNTLTGEVTRSRTLRLRWPFVRRRIETALVARGWSPERRHDLLGEIEADFKAPFPVPTEESLAGGLANTIAGRICNYLDLHGGGFTVDGACSSSLLAVNQAVDALRLGRARVAIVGGVDMSLDPFELVGFARAGALARDSMWVYDRRSQGFWPGEGCGFVVLCPLSVARRHDVPIHALIRGVGLSSDGHGGLTRPEVAGQAMALSRAYADANISSASIGYYEGHGTGTVVGDGVELRAIERCRRADAPRHRAAIGSIKANIGHTKAAAGLAGLIKATLAVSRGVRPPTTGCHQPHEGLQHASSTLEILHGAEPWQIPGPRRAAVSAMGFGGINTHVVLEQVDRPASRPRSREIEHPLHGQEHELLLLSAPDASSLRERAARLRTSARLASMADITDLAAQLAARPIISSDEPCRAALIVRDALELDTHLSELCDWLDSGVQHRVDGALMLGDARQGTTLHYLFPGQGARTVFEPHAAWRRFEATERAFASIAAPTDGIEDSPSSPIDATESAQPAIVAASLAGLELLSACGVQAHASAGHSLGELTALHWAGAIDADRARDIARARGDLMAQHAHREGGMLAVEISPTQFDARFSSACADCTVAAYNGPERLVLAGPDAALRAAARTLADNGIRTRELRSSHAFHSPAIAPATRPFRSYLTELPRFSPLRGRVASSVTGTELEADHPLVDHLCEQLCAPVRFDGALARLAEDHRRRGDEHHTIIEIGSGASLQGLIAQNLPSAQAFALEVGSPNLIGLLRVLAAAHIAGQSIDTTLLFGDRDVRTPTPRSISDFLTNPCEDVSLPASDTRRLAPEAQTTVEGPSTETRTPPAESIPVQVHDAVAAATGLPSEHLAANHRLLTDLHLNSLVVARLLADIGGRLGRKAPVAAMDFADATLQELSEAFARAPERAPDDAEHEDVPGVDTWCAAFRVEWHATAPLPEAETRSPWRWSVIADADDPLAAGLRSSLEPGADDDPVGLLVSLPERSDRLEIGQRLLSAVRRLRERGHSRLMVLTRQSGIAGFVRSLHLEWGSDACIVEIAPQLDATRSVQRVCSEAQYLAPGYHEAYIDALGVRHVARQRAQTLPSLEETHRLDLGAHILALGGGRGITAHCVRGLLERSDARVTIFGRSRPEDNEDLVLQLAQLPPGRWHYEAVDVSDPRAVARAMAEIEPHGPVTTLLHGAGFNRPCKLAELDIDDLARTVAAKCDGLEHVLAHIDAASLRCLITFGSIIGRLGLPGQADYAFANDQLRAQTEAFAAAHPGCRCLALEWSVWSQIGMGADLGSLDNLRRVGVVPLEPDRARDLMLAALAGSSTTTLQLTGRHGQGTTAPEADPLPMLRYLERRRVHYPGAELIVDIDLDRGRDPYLDDHRIGNQAIVPTVSLLEAVAQAARVLELEAHPDHQNAPFRFDDLQIDRPVTVADRRRIRVCCLRVEDRIEAVVRSHESDFAVDHLRVMVRSSPPEPAPVLRTGELEDIAFDPGELYGDDRPLFHGPRYQTITRYQSISAWSCRATVRCEHESLVGPKRPPPDQPHNQQKWFGSFEAQATRLGPAGVRDAFIHALQVCIPGRRVLPVSVGRIVTRGLEPGQRYHLVATARGRAAADHRFDLDVYDAEGIRVEQWLDLRLRHADSLTPAKVWPAPLLGAALERRLAARWPELGFRAVLEPSSPAASDIDDRRSFAAARLAPRMHEFESRAHARNATLLVRCDRAIGCDLEAVPALDDAQWRDMLGPANFELAGQIAKQYKESPARACTRIWVALEALKKSGREVTTPLGLAPSASDEDAAPGYEDIWLRAGRSSCLTLAKSTPEAGHELVAGVCIDARL